MKEIVTILKAEDNKVPAWEPTQEDVKVIKADIDFDYIPSEGSQVFIHLNVEGRRICYYVSISDFLLLASEVKSNYLKYIKEL